MLLALAVMASAAFNSVSAQNKKEKKNKKSQKVEVVAAPLQAMPAATVAPVSLKSKADSVSYAAGMALTNGLMPFLKSQFQLSDADMPAFIAAFEKAVAERKNPNQKAVAAGLQIEQMVTGRMLPGLEKDFTGDEAINEDLVFQGFTASLKNDSSVFTQKVAEDKFQNYRVENENRKNEATRKAGEDFLAQNKTKPGVVTLPDGLQYKVLTAGNGPKPTAKDKVEVVYEGRTIDGKVFDATSKHNGKKTDTFNASAVIKGWTEALTLMPVGSEWEIYIPYKLAYGERGAGRDIKPFETLIFKLKLVNIVKEEAKAAAAKTAPSKPTTAKKTAPKKPVRGTRKAK